MASASSANGSASAPDGLSAAERLMKQHAAGEADSHNVSLEEVPDEEFTMHPPPSTLAAAPVNPESAELPAEPTFSSKAAGKQPVREQPQAAPPKPALDTSEDAFPALGPPKPQVRGAAPSPWSKKPASVGKATNGATHGLTNGSAASSTFNSQTSSPPSGIPTPSTTTASTRGPAPQMSIPGRYSEQIQLHPSMMTPRNQLKKPVTDILRDINKRSKANVEMKAGPGGVVVFEGTGPVDAVRVALKEVATQLCSKQNLSVPVPASVRGKIVGKQGATIQAISKKTGARINVSKQEAAEILEDDDMDSIIDVTIEGDPFAVQMAKQDIEKIVAEHTSSVNARLKHIPAEYYPFLAGPNNAQVKALQQSRDLKMNIPHYQHWRNEAPPQTPASRAPVQFSPQANLPIHLSGDRKAVAEAKAEIDRQVAELERQLTLEQMAIERGRHQFIVGDLGTSLNDFMAETGCSVILPPEGDDSETLTVVGPPDRIEEGMNKIMDLASSMSMASADIGRLHANAPRGAQAHASDITRYLQQRQAIEQLERMHNARIVPDSAGAWQIYARDGKNAMKARSDVMNLISGHPPTRFQPVEVDPFYHQHLRERAASSIREQHGVHVIVPDEGDDAPVLLVFEDTTPAADYDFPRRQPSAQEVQAFEQALQQAQQEILNLMIGREDIVSRDVEAPVKYHDKIRRHVDRHHDALAEGSIPLQVLYGGPREAQQRRTPAPSVNLRGPQSDVDLLMQSLLAFIEQEKVDELERGFVLSFDYPQKYANHLIGKKGENINRLREEFDVEIQVNDGKCEIKGPEAKANACKKHIVDMLKKLEDETTHHLNIPAQYHRDLIGPQGTQVNRLQERYNVRVNFPRTRQNADDAASEAGESVAGRRNDQQPNEVVIKGPSKGADGCREELLSLFQYVKDNSFTATVSVAQSQLPSLIGSGGKEMESMRLETGAQIDVPGARDAGAADSRAEIRIKGSKKAVEEAKKLIEEKAKVFDNTVTRQLEVDRRHHRLIIGPGGTTLRNIINQAGGPEDVRLHNRMVRFPRADAEGNTVRIEGQRTVVDQICTAIEALVAQHESQTNDVVEVKPEKHRLLIGRGGEIRRQLEQQFNVSINVPRQNESGPQRSQVRIAGQPGDVEKAKAHVLELTKEVEGETVQVPRRFHQSIADNGQFFRRLRNDHKVTVDHAGQKPPGKASAPTPSRATGAGTAMPLITDDQTANLDQHSWETHDLHASTEEGDIPWVLAGPNPESISAARARLEKALEEARAHDTVGFLILPDPRTYRHVIGQGGSEINRIRKQTGTKIQVPRDQSKGEAIEIVGEKSGVEAARELILEVVGKNA
ncbi:RNA-binding G protein effector of mating response pathway [Neohortaea acidophila]|uniref:RNA-binding G protein effector of mating response pathway n=1 Tax=Neohortaea acidophila TaxID=245834 RepID=A0A6A6Q2L1_9PEZI|nr:RNA-binding G protein effector of mating response pathway [Neohortaea acidophila]KAF2485657.1 RNA-binding G protein effector of mating response pathway [Neohortaea acidophila]